jgi:hypothetical protein
VAALPDPQSDPTRGWIGKARFIGQSAAELEIDRERQTSMNLKN